MIVPYVSMEMFYNFNWGLPQQAGCSPSELGITGEHRLELALLTPNFLLESQMRIFLGWKQGFCWQYIRAVNRARPPVLPGKTDMD